ncbi:hypothetical protein [Rhodococcus sp. (in: high G+C Gram-positive bacteria)]|uniref:hypothetical protein n=1 Tax=Rhodococcus sp. TaxID=1831 RepID=UPI003B8A86A6
MTTVPAVLMDVCRPDRPLPAVEAHTGSTCLVCDSPMICRWDGPGIDFTWVDEQGRRAGGESPIPGVTTVGDYLTHLLNEDRIAEYSDFSARAALGSGILPWQHWHRPRPRPRLELPGGVPECCGMPMQLVRDGWRCRQRRTLFRRADPDSIVAA